MLLGHVGWQAGGGTGILHETLTDGVCGSIGVHFDFDRRPIGRYRSFVEHYDAIFDGSFENHE
jgi:hypothetical protein